MSLEFTDQELSAIRAEYCKGATDTQFDLFISECKARSLRPGVHLVFQLRNSKEYDPTIGASVFVKKPYWITTIAALRLIAQRTGEYLGQGPDEFVYLDDAGLPTVKWDIPLPVSKTDSTPREPWAARAKVYRKGFTEPMIGMARFEAYAGTRKVDKNSNEVVLTDMWLKRGSEQLQKCAEALALRKAFAEEMSGLMILEELKDVEEHTPAAVTPASVVPVPPSAPKVNQHPAVASETPRPGEAKTEYHVTEVPATLPAHSGDTLKVVEKDPKAEALKAVPDLKPASELPAPKKKGGRPKKEESPNNGQVRDDGITDADIPKPGEVFSEPVVIDKQETEDFIESLDPTPTKEEQAGFTARVRALAAAGAQNQDLKNYILGVGKKSDPKELTVGNWSMALGELETALSESKDKLKEITKNAPLPKF